MFYLLYSMIQFLFFWFLLSLVFRIFKGSRSRQDDWKHYSEWNSGPEGRSGYGGYGSDNRSGYGGYGWNGSFGGNPYSQSSAASLTRAYRTLGLSPEAPDSEVKSAFKKLAVKYHPDKYATESQDVQHAAEEKFKTINEAYQLIRKQRGLDS